MQVGTWRWPGGEEYALRFEQARDRRVLIIPALFEEGNKLRHFTIEVMRRLDASGIDCMLPDLPGSNESLQPLESQSLESWRKAMGAAAKQFGATQILAIRGGALCLPSASKRFVYAPVAGESLLRAMLRARVLVDREAGLASTREDLLAEALTDGISLAGYRLGATMVAQLHAAGPPAGTDDIEQTQIGGGGLWLRAEPAHDAEQAEALAHIALERLA